LGKGTGRDDYPAMHDGNTVRQLFGFLQVLGRQQYGHIPPLTQEMK